jgi:RNA polymerase sigma-70 factor (ECF subfamily)
MDLVDAAIGGDGAAFREIVLRFDSGLRALAFRLLRDRDRMDDVLQEAYLKAFRALPRFHRDARLGTWLYRITYNACLDELLLRSLSNLVWSWRARRRSRDVGWTVSSGSTASESTSR